MVGVAQPTGGRVGNAGVCPDILLSGDHGKIAQWRRDQSLERTRQHRPDLL